VVPHKYFSPLPAALTEPVAAAAAAATGAEPAPVASAETAEAADTTPGGLPRRRSRRSDPSTPSARPRPAERTEETVAAVPPDASFTGLAAFAAAGRESEPPRETTADRAPAGGGETAAGREFNEHRTEESD
jgi:hypothetical protein